MLLNNIGCRIEMMEDESDGNVRRKDEDKSTEEEMEKEQGGGGYKCGKVKRHEKMEKENENHDSQS